MIVVVLKVTVVFVVRGGIMAAGANSKTKEMRCCKRIAITSVDPTLFHIELARFHCNKVFPSEKIHGSILRPGSDAVLFMCRT